MRPFPVIDTHARTPLWPLLILLPLAALHRLVPALGQIHRADALVLGVMAEDIAQGRAYPLVYYGQGYMGSIEAWLMAPLFAITGPTWWGLTIVPVLVSLVGVVTFYYLGHSLGGRVAAIATSLFWALPPFAITYYGVTPRGCYPEVVAGGAFLLWYGVERWKGRHFGVAASFGVGLVMGLLLWTSLLSAASLGMVALVILVVEGKHIFNHQTAGGVGGFFVGGLPFLALMSQTVGGDTVAIGFDQWPRRFGALWVTLTTLFVPYADLAPPLWLTLLCWGALLLLALALALVTLRSLLPTSADSAWRHARPLTIFTLLFLFLYLINNNSLQQAERYLLPLLIPLYAAAGVMTAQLWSRWRSSVAVAAIIPLAGFFLTGSVFASLDKTSDESRRLIVAAMDRFDTLGLQSVVWPDYEIAHQLSYEAMTRGSGMRAMALDGSRIDAITRRVERDENSGLVLATYVDQFRAQLRSCCKEEYAIDYFEGYTILSRMKPIRQSLLSIPPNRWDFTKTARALGDRHFATTVATDQSVVVIFQAPERVGRIRAIWGGRQPQTIAIDIEGETGWREVAPAIPPALFVPMGKKVFTRAMAYDREWQEWHFDTVTTRSIRFRVTQPVGSDFDIHELFFYEPQGGGAPVESTTQDVSEAIAAAAVKTLLADRWWRAQLVDEMKETVIVSPALRPVEEATARARWSLSPGFGALVRTEDSAELVGRLKKRGAGFDDTGLGAYHLLVVTHGEWDAWWTGFTLIDW